MLCRVCEEIKLSKEFVFENLNDECNHPPLFCMRCAMAASHTSKRCPYPECDHKITCEDAVIVEYKTILQSMFPEQEEEAADLEDELPGLLGATIGGTLSVTLLTGEAEYFPFTPKTTVTDLKNAIAQKMRVPVEKQKLLYNESVLEEYKDGSISKLTDYNVQNGSKIYLLILLYAVPKSFNHVVFDLYWHYPASGRDYLDASCLAFSQMLHIDTCDYQHTRRLSHSLCHSGDVMNNRQRLGHHTIEVKLQQIPPHITHLFFTLSAWNSPTIRHFPNPSLKFFEASNRGKDLCSTSFTHALASQAVVMCSVVRTANGGWNIFRSGKPSAGNAKQYKPLIKTIKDLIHSGM